MERVFRFTATVTLSLAEIARALLAHPVEPTDGAHHKCVVECIALYLGVWTDLLVNLIPGRTAVLYLHVQMIYDPTLQKIYDLHRRTLLKFL